MLEGFAIVKHREGIALPNAPSRLIEAGDARHRFIRAAIGGFLITLKREVLNRGLEADSIFVADTEAIERLEIARFRPLFQNPKGLIAFPFAVTLPCLPIRLMEIHRYVPLRLILILAGIEPKFRSKEKGWPFAIPQG